MYRMKTACNDQVSFGPVLVLMLFELSIALPTCLQSFDKYSKSSVILNISSSVPKSIVEVKYYILSAKSKRKLLTIIQRQLG